MNNNTISSLSQESLNKELVKAVNANDLNYVKYLLASPELSLHADPTRCFEIACGAGYLEITKYLLNNPEVKFKLSRKGILIHGVYLALSHNKTELLDYFRNEAIETEPISELQLLKQNLTILENACSLGHLDIVKYIFENPKVPGEAFDNYSENINKLFEKSIYNGHPDLVRYFIFIHNIPKSEPIEKLLQEITGPERKEINRLFELRETNKSLKNDLSSNDNNKIKPTKI